MERRADVNKKTKKDETSLYYAVKKSNESIIRLLLENGARINEKMNQGKTAFHHACEIGKSEVVRLLLENEADVNILDDNEETPLMKSSPEVEKILTKHLAKLKFQSRPICIENIEYLKKIENLQKLFDDNLNKLELQKMGDLQI